MNEETPPTLTEKYVAEIFVVISAIHIDYKEGKLSTRDVIDILNKYYDFGDKMIELLKKEVDHEIMTTILESHEDYQLVHYSYTIKFQGCQCIKDCTCREDYKPWNEEYYRVVPTDPSKGRGQKFYKYELALKLYNKLTGKCSV